jgi:glucose-6-phosphate 1-dehydrogenase
MPVTATEVVLRFRPAPYNLFGLGSPNLPVKFRFRIWPEAAIGLHLAGKRPGAAWHGEIEELAFAQQPGSDMRPYDRLVGAALEGNRVPFARQDAVEAAWRVVDPILGDVVPVHEYSQGSWGPKEADALLPNGDTWHDPAGEAT